MNTGEFVIYSIESLFGYHSVFITSNPINSADIYAFNNYADGVGEWDHMLKANGAFIRCALKQSL